MLSAPSSDSLDRYRGAVSSILSKRAPCADDDGDVCEITVGLLFASATGSMVPFVDIPYAFFVRRTRIIASHPNSPQTVVVSTQQLSLDYSTQNCPARVLIPQAAPLFGSRGASRCSPLAASPTYVSSYTPKSDAAIVYGHTGTS